MANSHSAARNVLTSAFVLCLFAAGLLACPSAYAVATAESSATIDWTTFGITLGDGMNLDWTFQGGYAEAEVKHNGVSKQTDYHEGAGWGDVSATAAFATANGSAAGAASATGSTLSATSSASSNLGGKFEGGGHGWSENRFGRFQVTGSGTITLSVNYSLSTTLNEGSPRPWDLAISDVGATLLLQNGIWVSENNEIKWIAATEDRKTDSIWYPDWADPLNGTDGRSGTLTASLFFNDGDLGYMSAAVSAGVGATSVPLPPALYLLAPGLAGLVALRRRFVRLS